MLFQRLDLPLASDVTGRFLAWIIALMVYLAVLAAAGAMVLSSVAARWDNGGAGTLTVQISPLDQPGSAALPPVAQRTDTALALLRATPGIAHATPLAPEETAKLLEPWLGPDALKADLPVPILIDVELAGTGTVDVPALAARLAEAVPGASLDDHALWMGDLLVLARVFQVLALAVVGLIGTAAVVVVVFTVRAGMAIHGAVIELLHLMGAADFYVARQFQSHVMVLAAKGATAGTVLSVLTLIGIGAMLSGIHAELLPRLALSLPQWSVLAVIPAVAAGLAMITARLTVMRTLAEMP